MPQVPVLVAHTRGCRFARPDRGGHTDAAKRVADIHNLHLTAGAAFCPNPHIGRIAAVALADGRSDGALYPSLQVAAAHQHHNEKWFAYLRITNGGMSVCDAETFLRTHRLFFEAGWRLVDADAPDGGRVPIPQLTVDDDLALLRRLASRS